MLLPQTAATSSTARASFSPPPRLGIGLHDRRVRADLGDQRRSRSPPCACYRGCDERGFPAATISARRTSHRHHAVGKSSRPSPDHGGRSTPRSVCRVGGRRRKRTNLGGLTVRPPQPKPSRLESISRQPRGSDTSCGVRVGYPPACRPPSPFGHRCFSSDQPWAPKRRGDRGQERRSLPRPSPLAVTALGEGWTPIILAPTLTHLELLRAARATGSAFSFTASNTPPLLPQRGPVKLLAPPPTEHWRRSAAEGLRPTGGGHSHAAVVAGLEGRSFTERRVLVATVPGLGWAIRICPQPTLTRSKIAGIAVRSSRRKVARIITAPRRRLARLPSQRPRTCARDLWRSAYRQGCPGRNPGH